MGHIENDKVPILYLQSRIIMPFSGLVNFVPAVAYHFCLNFLAAFSQTENSLIVQLCTSTNIDGGCHNLLLNLEYVDK